VRQRCNRTIGTAYEQVEEQEDEHLYHTTGWGLELWIRSLGMPDVLPPPEEEKDEETAIGAEWISGTTSRQNRWATESNRIAISPGT
jgi:hypothetical protein